MLITIDHFAFPNAGVQPKVNITKLELNGATSVLFSYEVTQGKVPVSLFLSIKFSITVYSK